MKSIYHLSLTRPRSTVSQHPQGIAEVRLRAKRRLPSLSQLNGHADNPLLNPPRATHLSKPTKPILVSAMIKLHQRSPNDKILRSASSPPFPARPLKNRRIAPIHQQKRPQLLQPKLERKSRRQPAGRPIALANHSAKKMHFGICIRI